MKVFRKLLKKQKIDENLISKITSGEFKSPKLDLSGKNLKNSDLGPIIECLSHTTIIKELDLSNNLIEDIDFIGNIKVGSVNISANPIMRYSEKCSNQYVTHLTLNQTFLKKFDFNLFKNLQFLEFRGNQLLNIENIIFNSTLSHLDLSENIFSKLSFIIELKNLTTLIAANNKLTDLDFARGSNSLKNVLLQNNQINCLDALSVNQTIEFLNIDYNRVENILPLAFNKKLTTISIQDNPIKDFKPLIFNYSLKQTFFPLQNDKILKIIMTRNNECADAKLSGENDRNTIISKYNSLIPQITPLSLRALTFFSKPIQENNLTYIQTQIKQHSLTTPFT